MEIHLYIFSTLVIRYHHRYNYVQFRVADRAEMEHHMPRGKRNDEGRYTWLYSESGEPFNYHFGFLTGAPLIASTVTNIHIKALISEQYICIENQPYFLTPIHNLQKFRVLKAPGDLNKGLPYSCRFLNKLYFSCCGRSQKWSPVSKLLSWIWFSSSLSQNVNLFPLPLSLIDFEICYCQ